MVVLNRKHQTSISYSSHVVQHFLNLKRVFLKTLISSFNKVLYLVACIFFRQLYCLSYLIELSYLSCPTLVVLHASEIYGHNDSCTKELLS